MIDAGPAEMSTIRRRAYDQPARDMAAQGVRLTHEQADEIGDGACNWIARRLSLTMATDDRGVTFAPVDRRPGRPARAGEQTHPLTIRATNTERGQWEDAATRGGLTLADWLRAAAAAALAHGATR